MSVVTTGVSSASGFPPVDHMVTPTSPPGSRLRPPRRERVRIKITMTRGAYGSTHVR